jgi:hypothetical protein
MPVKSVSREQYFEGDLRRFEPLRPIVELSVAAVLNLGGSALLSKLA